MSEYGVQPDGSFERKHIDEIVDDLETKAEEELGGDVDLEQGSPVKQIIDMMALEIDRQWQALEENYYIAFYEDTFGDALDRMLGLAGFSRKSRRSATGEVVFSTDSPNAAGVGIDEGTLVETEATETKPAIQFKTTQDVVLDAGDTSVTAPITALPLQDADVDEEWLGEETNVEAGTITNIVNPIFGVDSVNNPNPTGDESLGYTRGRDRETDPEFKIRYENTLAEGGTSTNPAMQHTIFEWDDRIVSVRVDERRDGSTQEFGPEVTVLAPELETADGRDIIAQAIFESRAAGTESFGTESGTAETTDGRQFTENFEFATEQTIYIDANLTTADTFPSDGETRIENNLIRFIGGLAHDDVNYPGLEIGEDVVYDQVKKRVMQVRGVVEADVTVGTADDPTGMSNISIANLEVAMTGISEIDITGV